MTVKDLIAELSRHDPELPVVIPYIGDDFADVRTLELRDLYHDEGEDYWEASEGHAPPRRTPKPALILR
jgi:hypothetical protein